MFIRRLPLYCMGARRLFDWRHYTLAPFVYGSDLHQYVTHMTPDLNLPPISASGPRTGPSSPAAAASTVPLEALRPIAAALLAPGENAEAQVVRNTPRDGQFEVLLRLAKAGAPTAEVSVVSPQPLPSGNRFSVQSITPTQL